MSLFRVRPAPLERRQVFPVPPVPAYPGAPNDYTARSSDPMRITSVWRAASLISDVVSMIPFEAFAPQADGTTRKMDEQPEILVNPSADLNPFEFRESVMLSALLRGNAYGFIARADSMGLPLQIELVHPDEVQVDDPPRRPGAAAAVTYRFNGEDVPRSRVWHFRARRMPGHATGMSPIAYHAETLGLQLSALHYGIGYYTDAPHPPAILSTEESVSEDIANEIKQRFNRMRQTREVAVLGNGVKYQTITPAASETMFLDALGYGVSDVARIFGLPSEMIGGSASSGSITYANVGQKAIDLLKFSFQPWVTRLEHAYYAMIPGRKYVRGNVNELLRTDFLTRVQARAIAIASSQMVPSEARAEDDRAPLTDDQKAELVEAGLTITLSGKPKPVIPHTAPEAGP